MFPLYGYLLRSTYLNLYFRFVEEHKEKVKTDTLQRLHTVVNLSELLAIKHEGIDPTLRDDQVCVRVKSFNILIPELRFTKLFYSHNPNIGGMVNSSPYVECSIIHHEFDIWHLNSRLVIH